MSPLVAYHATRPACREGIVTNGLLPSSYPRHRPYGVYVFRMDGSFDHLCWNSRTYWDASPRADVWQVAYIGPLMIDQYVQNGMILLGTVDRVTLVTGNDYV